MSEACEKAAIKSSAASSQLCQLKVQVQVKEDCNSKVHPELCDVRAALASVQFARRCD